MGFSRTESGILSKHLFYRVPILWVEGDDDTLFYCHVIKGLQCRMEPTFGRANSEALIRELAKNNVPYAVVVDGDYDVLEGGRMPHRRAIRLKRYAMENYICRPDIVKSLCAQFCGTSATAAHKIAKKNLEFDENIEQSLAVLVHLDIASIQSGAGVSVIPDRPDRYLRRKNRHLLDKRKLGKQCSSIAPKLDGSAITAAKRKVDAFLRSRPMRHLVPGHFLFGMYRRFYTEVSHHLKGRRPNIDNRNLLMMMALETWTGSLNNDHRILKSRIRRAVLEARRLL